MEPGYVLLIVLITLVIGITIGRIVDMTKKNSDEVQGILYVNCDAPDGQGLFLEQTVPTSGIASRKRVIFEVVVIRHDSQK